MKISYLEFNETIIMYELRRILHIERYLQVQNTFYQFQYILTNVHDPDYIALG